MTTESIWIGTSLALCISSWVALKLQHGRLLYWKDRSEHWERCHANRVQHIESLNAELWLDRNDQANRVES